METQVRGFTGGTFHVSVSKSGDKWDGGCSCGFRSAGWATKKQGELRMSQHLHEHGTGEESQELVDFIANPITPTTASMDESGDD